MKKPNSVFVPSVIAASIMAVYGTAWSADNASLDELTKPSSEVSVGIGGWTDNRNDRQNLGRYDGMGKDDTFLLLDANVHKRNDETGTWLNLNINDLGTHNREVRAEYLQQGKQGVTLEYSEFRFDAPYTINTNTTGIGTPLQTLGANIPNTAIGSGANYQLGTDRKKTGLNFYKSLMPSLDFTAKFSSEDKTGDRLTANGSALFVAELIDRTTKKAEVTLNYHEGKLQVSGGYYGSWFTDNGVGYTALRSTSATTLAASNVMTQPLDNQSHQVFVDGSYRFTPTTKGTFKLAYTKGTQDEHIPTSDLVSGTTYANVPSLHGEVHTTLLQLGLTAKPMPKLSVVANLRYNDRNDKTPQILSVPNTSGVGATVALNSTPWSYKTTNSKLEATYQLSDGYNGTAGVDYNSQDRTVWSAMNGVAYNPYVPSRNRLDETTLRLQLSKSLSETLNGSVAFLRARRAGSDFQPDTQTGTSSVSPVNTADRDREKLRFTADWSPAEKLNFQFTAEASSDRYGDNIRSQGLQRGDAELLSLDASYALNEAWQITGWYSYNTNNAHFRNYWNGATLSREKKQNDTGDAVGLNLTGQVSAKTKIGAEFAWSSDKTAFVQSQSDGAATGAVAPNIVSKVTRLNLFANHTLDKKSEVRVGLAYQKSDSNDWQWTYQNGAPWQFGTTTDGTTVLTTPVQQATFVSARYIYKFQ